MQEFKVYKILGKSVIKNNEVGGQPFIAVTEGGYCVSQTGVVNQDYIDTFQQKNLEDAVDSWNRKAMKDSGMYSTILKVGVNGKSEAYVHDCESLSDSGYIVKLCCNGIFYSYNGGKDWIQLG